jgi:predicted DCC family thiol-disulfide oxidoreductase YuxK
LSESAQISPQVTLLFDGACHLCSREIRHYRRLNGDRRLAFVDISADDFKPESWNLDARAVNKEMHVRLADGSYRVGLAAFVAVWEVLPHYRWLARLAQTPGIAQIMRAGYAAFAAVRPLLPKRANPGASCRVTF